MHRTKTQKASKLSWITGELFYSCVLYFLTAFITLLIRKSECCVIKFIFKRLTNNADEKDLFRRQNTVFDSTCI